MKRVLQSSSKALASATLWLLCVQAVACRDQAAAPQDPPDLSQPLVAPDPCTLEPSEPSCTPDDTKLGAGGAAGQGGAAGTAGAAGAAPNATDAARSDDAAGSALCLVRAEARLSCPSQVGAMYAAHAADGSLDLLVAQLGLDGRGPQGEYLRNQLAYFEAHRIAESERSRFEERVVPPFVAARDALDKALALIPATGTLDTLLVEHLAAGDATPGSLRLRELFGSGDVLVDFPFAEAPIINASGSSAQDAGVFVEYQPFHHFSLVLGLPDAPRLIQPGEPPSALAIGADPSGALVAVTHDRMHLTGLSGPNLERVDFVLPADTGVNSPSVDFVFVGPEQTARQAVLYRHGDNDDHQVLFVNANHEASPPAAVAHYTTSDCNSFGIGLTCDDCPEGRKCQVHEENVRAAKLFTAGDRVFAAYVATDTVETRVAVKHTTGIGIGCTCGTDAVSTETIGDTLVAFEIVDAGPELRPEVVEVMRVPLESAASSRVLFQRDSRGNLDLLLGPSFGRFYDGLAQFPEAPREYRIVRLAAPIE